MRGGERHHAWWGRTMRGGDGAVTRAGGGSWSPAAPLRFPYGPLVVVEPCGAGARIACVVRLAHHDGGAPCAGGGSMCGGAGHVRGGRRWFD